MLTPVSCADTYFEGCYIFNIEPSWSKEAATVLNGILSPGVYDLSSMTNAKCVQLAPEKGFLFAGTKPVIDLVPMMLDISNSQTWCFGRNTPAGFLTGDEYCSSECSGNPSQKCGAPDMASVSRTTVGIAQGRPSGPHQKTKSCYTHTACLLACLCGCNRALLKAPLSCRAIFIQ